MVTGILGGGQQKTPKTPIESTDSLKFSRTDEKKYFFLGFTERSESGRFRAQISFLTKNQVPFFWCSMCCGNFSGCDEWKRHGFKALLRKNFAALVWSGTSIKICEDLKRLRVAWELKFTNRKKPLHIFCWSYAGKISYSICPSSTAAFWWIYPPSAIRAPHRCVPKKNCQRQQTVWSTRPFSS